MNNSKENENGMDIIKSYKSQKKALYWLLALIYLSFIGLQLGRIQAIADFNYNLHEMMYLPFSISMFLVPVLFLIYIFLFIKYIRKRGKKKIDSKTVLQSIAIIFSVVIIISITEYQFQEVSTAGVFEVKDKIQDDRKYYLLIDEKNIKVSYNEFQLVKANQQYLISFIWNKRNPDKGILQTIELIN